MGRRVTGDVVAAGERKRATVTLRLSVEEAKVLQRAVASIAWLPSEGYRELKSVRDKLREAVK